MAFGVFQEIEMEFTTHAEKIARRFSQRVKDDGFVIKLSDREQVMTFGLDSADNLSTTGALQSACNALCTETITRNEPIILECASELWPDESDPPIVGCMGQPIQGDSGEPLGAICAVSMTQRAWSSCDRLAFELARVQTEQLLARTIINNQNNSLAYALSEYDDILTTIAANAKQMLSVHGPSGDLLFATNALLKDLRPDVLESQVRASISDNDAAPNCMELAVETNNGRQAAGDTSTAGDARTETPGPVAKISRASVQTHANQVMFVEWDTGKV